MLPQGCPGCGERAFPAALYILSSSIPGLHNTIHKEEPGIIEKTISAKNKSLCRQAGDSCFWQISRRDSNPWAPQGWLCNRQTAFAAEEVESLCLHQGSGKNSYLTLFSQAAATLGYTLSVAHPSPPESLYSNSSHVYM